MPDFVSEIDKIIVCADGKLTVDHIVHEIVPVCERVEWQATFFEDVGGDKFASIKVVLGMGGISCAEDALEFIMAGAKMVAAGTANFHNPAVTEEIIDGIKEFMEKNGVKDINELTGCVK